jgi:UDP-3-O-[3-hydroxymyristoyl] glucosamine N-acyltransferase
VKTLSLKQIADELGLPLEGPDVPDIRPAFVEDAGPGCICLAGSDRFASMAAEAGASALMADEGVAVSLPCIRSRNARLDWGRLLGLFAVAPARAAGVHATAVIEPGADVHPTASIGPNCVIRAGARIGESVVLEENCVVHEDAVVGARTVMSAGAFVGARCIVGCDCVLKQHAVVGGEGFGFEWDGTRHVHVPHAGIVVLEDDVWVGSGSCIDRAKAGETRIGRGCRIDNLVQVAHNVRVGAFTVLVSQVGIAGSTTIGDGCVLAGQAGVADHVHIGPGATIGARAGISGDLPGGDVYMGLPARKASDWRRILAAESRLPDLLRRVRRLEKALGTGEDADDA